MRRRNRRRYRLARSREDLARARCRGRRSGRHRACTQRWMDGRAGCQGRPDGRGLAQRFFGGGRRGSVFGRNNRRFGGSRWHAFGSSGFASRRLSLRLDRFRLGDRYGRRSLGLDCRFFGALDALPDQFRNRIVNGAGVSLLLGNAEIRQHVHDDVRRNFEFPGQLVDTDFAHITRRLTDFLRVLYGIRFLFLIRRIGDWEFGCFWRFRFGFRGFRRVGWTFDASDVGRFWLVGNAC